jgi:putative transposase
MTNTQKEQIAIFRFGVIFPLLEKNIAWGEQKKLLQQLSCRQWEIPFSNRTHIGGATILNWVRRYRDGGERIEALFPSDRSDCGRQRSISDETLAALLHIRKEKPSFTIKKVVEEAYKRKIISKADRIALSSVYRLFRIHDQKTRKKQEDMRRFEVELSNDLWQADALHAMKVTHEGKLRKSYLFVILDDKSRMIVGSGFYLDESADSFINCLSKALKSRGIPRILYVDNGSSFRNHRLAIGCAALQISLRYATAYRPEGSGKVERFNKTVRMQFLPDILEGISLEELNQRWQKYLDTVYHQRRHSSTGQTPLQRYLDDAHALRGAPEQLPDYFRHREERTVSNDRTIRLSNRVYQVPLGLAGMRVELRFETLDRVELFVDGKSHGFIEEVPLHANSRIGRVRNQSDEQRLSLKSGTLFDGGK